VKVQVEGDGDTQYFPARVIAFVALLTMQQAASAGSEGGTMLALVEWYVSALPGPTDLSNTDPSLPLPFIKVEPMVADRYALLDTADAISSGLWVQPDFEVPERFWVVENHWC